jgi:hypothetical protein
MRPLTVIVSLLTGASAAAFGAYCFGKAQHPPALAQPVFAGVGSVESPEADPNVAEDIGLLNRRLAALELKQAQQKPSEATVPNAQPTAGPGERLDPAALKRVESERAAMIDSTLRTEPRDVAWAPTTEGELRTAVDGAVKEGGAHFAVKSMRCLTSICEMVLSAASPDQLQGTEFSLGQRITGMGSVDIGPPETAADGTATVTYRLYRQGRPRPDEGI